MADIVALSASRHNQDDVITLAVAHGLGVELMLFAYPDVLDGNIQQKAEALRPAFDGLLGPLSLHGPFFDMISGSPDERISAVTRTRYRQCLLAASVLGASRIVVHANYIAQLRSEQYQRGWHRRNVLFWDDLLKEAADVGVTFLLENMWEFNPALLADLLREIDNPNLKACLDVGHAHVYSDPEFPFEAWVEALEPWLVHVHANNNNGVIDQHLGFHDAHGVLDYARRLPKLRALDPAPHFVLEMDETAAMRDSLDMFNVQGR